MTSIHSLGAFVSAATLVILVPGPATLLVAGHAHHSGWRAVRTTGGIVAGDLVLITLAGLGFSAVIGRWPALGLASTVVGALYVAWLGLSAWRAPADEQAPDSQRTERGGFAQGLALTLTNPKPILFFGAFFPLFIDRENGDGMRSFYALGAIFEAINLLYFALLIGLVARLRRLPALVGLSRGRLHKISGAGLMACAALMLATGVRPAPG